MPSIILLQGFRSVDKSAVLLTLPLAFILYYGVHNRRLPPRLVRRASGTVRTAIHTIRCWIKLHSFRWITRIPCLRSFLKASSSYRTYQSSEEEDEYWKNAERSQRELSYSDSRFDNTGLCQVWTPRHERQILYYTPRLLPEYREKRTDNIDRWTSHIPAKMFVKWHWLVFPNRTHPTILQASRLMQKFSHRDLQEIFRISKTIRDVDVIENNRVRYSHRLGAEQSPREQTPCITRYKTMWQTWLHTKGLDPDLVISFESE